MPTVTVPTERFRNGELPEVCAKTGGPADASWPASATASPPAWTWALLVLGIVPFFLVRRWIAKTVDGLVPLSNVATVRVVQATRLRTIGLLVGVALLVGSLFLDSPPMLLAAAGAVLMAVVATLAGAWWFVGAGWDPREETVTLKRVHPAFVEAVGHN